MKFKKIIRNVEGLTNKVKNAFVVKGWKIKPIFKIIKPQETDVGYLPHSDKAKKD